MAATMLSQMAKNWQVMDRSRRVLIIGAVVLCILAGLVVAISTRFGAGIGTDGVVYIAAARNMLAGEGISWIGPQGDVRPLAIFAPLYPIILAAISFVTGLDAWTVGRWLLVIVFAVNVLLLIVLVYRYSQRSLLALAAGVLFIFSRPMIENHTGVGSEPLFLTFLLSSLLTLSHFLRSFKRMHLVLSGIFMGLAFLTRYAGAYFMAGGALLLLIFSHQRWRERIRAAFLWSGINFLFVAGWLLRNRLVAGSGTARSWMPMLPPKALVENILSDLAFWFLPEVGPFWLRVLLVGLASSGILVALWLWRRRIRPGPPVFEQRSLGAGPAALLLLVGVYILGLILTRSLVVPRIDIISRTLFPAHVLIMLTMVYVVADLIALAGQGSTSSLVFRGLWIAIIGFVAIYVLRGSELILNLQKDGQGYASSQWSHSQLMNAMNLLPADTPIYTNHVEAVYLYTGRHPYRLPYGCLPEDVLVEKYAQADCQDPAYLEWVQSMRQKLEEEQAVIVLFGRTYEQVYDPLIPSLLEGLEPLSIQGDGAMYVQDVEQWPENPHW